jgi:hypothetical protein
METSCKGILHGIVMCLFQHFLLSLPSLPYALLSLTLIRIKSLFSNDQNLQMPRNKYKLDKFLISFRFIHNLFNKLLVKKYFFFCFFIYQGTSRKKEEW